ncbi:META domain-containing protein [Aurantiacibacter sp. MUD11]|uniref:META domain-containing protein n=1 Tax=Aurantiacibacter sp. MUD11 TaxID=3003265 RepID=UPI0022AA2BDD|nr:META domain-containing protein [Aurantiacibacter sp. MUD11]WAT16963.1 META domain-containing protein [Aurantiacibacter sp. MUD11]
MHSLKIAAVATAGSMLLAGCATTPELSPDERALIANTWYLESIIDRQEEIRLRPQLGDRHNITFLRDGSISLQLDCNRGNSSWDADPRGGGTGDLSIDRVASTRALCQSPSYGERLAAELPQVDSYELGVEGRSLMLRSDDTIFGFVAR